uniref:3-deoxy-7-phosphoheptulonate synthase n=1 Tax=Albugo laibachii Nc14 TaxID=890382 RepID=F0WTK3_9STRA|nr:hypothetical protein PROSTU_01578 [Albugo laibachii Nc14]|eukprot:CCA24694.1 hypothetical protein PROSTU_01578 [Albugo laibachii Nc14]
MIGRNEAVTTKSTIENLKIADSSAIIDVRIEGIRPLIPPSCLLEEILLSSKMLQTVTLGRQGAANTLRRTDDRLIVVVGPCSIHDVEAAVDYAKRLADLQNELDDDLLIIMRVYFEKPRTTVGWNGLINNPDLNGTYNINKVLRVARDLLARIKMQIPTGCEFLDTMSPQFISDMELAVNAVVAARHLHCFLSVSTQGLAFIVNTAGKDYCHTILRGGSTGPNYEQEHINKVCDLMRKAKLTENVMVDCSHGNSRKNHANQPLVAEDVGCQIATGDARIIGVMLESNLQEGYQKLVPGQPLEYGKSVTDACMGWDTTVDVLNNLAASVFENDEKIALRVSSRMLHRTSKFLITGISQVKLDLCRNLCIYSERVPMMNDAEHAHFILRLLEECMSNDLNRRTQAEAQLSIIVSTIMSGNHMHQNELILQTLLQTVSPVTDSQAASLTVPPNLRIITCIWVKNLVLKYWKSPEFVSDRWKTQVFRNALLQMAIQETNQVVALHSSVIVAFISRCDFPTRWGMEELFQPLVNCLQMPQGLFQDLDILIEKQYRAIDIILRITKELVSRRLMAHRKHFGAFAMDLLPFLSNHWDVIMNSSVDGSIVRSVLKLTNISTKLIAVILTNAFRVLATQDFELVNAILQKMCHFIARFQAQFSSGQDQKAMEIQAGKCMYQMSKLLMKTQASYPMECRQHLQEFLQLYWEI